MVIRFIEHLDRIQQVRFSHQAVVLANNDPQRLGRIQCTIPNIMVGSTAVLPWATPLSCGRGLGAGSVLDVPEVNSQVWIEFLNEDPYSPVYSVKGMFKGEIEDPLLGVPDSFADVPDPSKLSDYPLITGSVDSEGSYMKVNKKQGFTAFKHGPSGAYIVVDKNGNVGLETKKTGNLFLRVAGSVTANVRGNVVANVTGNLSATMSGTAYLKATEITFDGPVQITKTLNVTQSVTTPADVVASGVSLVNHIHSGVDSGLGTSGPPIA